ncbi:MAG: AAA family ATPase, partial [Chitinispirillaceae bacterium]|nr:AAA family ATPase [Chitinispirillaceae bacterium]
MKNTKLKHLRPRIQYLKVQNFRALKEIEIKDITPLTVFIGPNGSGKSTIFDVFAFLSECFELGLRRAWDKRGKAKEIKTKGVNGPVTIEIKYQEPSFPIITYHLSIDEERGSPIVIEEWLQWRRGSRGKPFRFLEYHKGEGRAISGENPNEENERVRIPLKSPELLAVNALGQFAEHPRVAALRDFITGWYLSYLSVENTHKQPEAGPQERLSKIGDNLANVIQYLSEQHPKRLEEIFEKLRQRIPRIEKVIAEIMPDGRLLLQIKDAPFRNPILARFASDGTLKMLAYLILLYDPNPPSFIGIEEPENFLHPRLLPDLAEEFRKTGMPVDVFGLEPGWHSHSYSCSYKWDEVRFPKPEKMLQDLNKLNYKVNLWEHVFVHPTADFYEELMDYAGEYEVWNGLVPDFSLEKSRNIFSEHHGRELIDKGVSGFKLDECDNSDFNASSWSFPNTTRFPSGMDGEQMHNMIGLLYQDTLLGAFKERNRRTLSQVRSSGALASSLPFVLY